MSCNEKNIVLEKFWYYRNIFQTEFNLAFHKPRKDQCDKCFKFMNFDEIQKSIYQDEQTNHLERKDLARQIKNSLKEYAKIGKCHLLEFDLEAVRPCPKTGKKAVFYKRRLAVYNLTVYTVDSKKANNYMWHEGIAKRGSVEVGYCLYLHLKEIANNIPVYMFSDSCGGQNRNSNMCAMLLYAVQKLDIPLITHNFFESGHSVIECDSVHAHIEHAARHVNIFDPSGWYTAVQMASKKRLYEVKEMSQNDFFDFVDLQKTCIKNKKVDDDKNAINWLKIVCFQFLKSEPNKIFFKYNNKGEFKSFTITRQTRKTIMTDYELKLAYQQPLKIENAKLKDLTDLCQSKLIPEQYHQFYYTLFDNDTSNNCDLEEEDELED